MKIINKELIVRFTNTPGRRNIIDEILSPILFGQRLIGAQIFDPNWTWKNNSIHLLLSALMLVYVMFGTLDVLKKSSDIQIVAEAAVTFVVIGEIPVTFLIFASNRKNLQQVYCEAKITLYDYISITSFEKAVRLRKILSYAPKLLFTLMALPITDYLTIAIWYYFHGVRVTLSKTTAILMPMETPYYELGFFLHLTFLVGCLLSVLVINIWFVILSFVFCEACECAEKVLDVENTGNDYEDRLNDGLRQFYKFHVRVVSYINSFSEIYEWLILVRMLTMIMTACIFLVLILTVHVVNFQLVAVMVPVMFEIISYNCMGEMVKSRDESLRTKILHFNWTSLKLKDKRNYLIIILNMTKSFGVKSAFGAELSIVTLSVIFKTVYQIFAVANSMQQH